MTYLEPWLNSGKLKCSENHLDLISQIDNYPYVQNDDLIEALREAVYHSFPSDGSPDDRNEFDKLDEKLKEILQTNKEKALDRLKSSAETNPEFGRWSETEPLFQKM